MKRSPMPLRKSSMRRGWLAASTIPANQPAVPRQPLRPVSKKRQAVQRVRAKVVRGMVEDKPWCARCGSTGVVLDGHEVEGRAHGADITKPEMLLCRPCNGWCEDKPVIAAWQGWKRSGKNDTAPCIEAGRCSPGSHEPFDRCAEVAA